MIIDVAALNRKAVRIYSNSPHSRLIQVWRTFSVPYAIAIYKQQVDCRSGARINAIMSPFQHPSTMLDGSAWCKLGNDRNCGVPKRPQRGDVAAC